MSNESNSSNWTFFDDLTVSRTSGKIKQESHYYPYGLVMADIGKEGSNPFTYQGKEWQTDLDLELYDFHARQFDPTTGRFFAVDPQGQFASGYVGMGNNPVVGVDPDGEFVLPFLANLAVNFGANLALTGGDFYSAVQNTVGSIFLPGPSFTPINAFEGIGNAVLTSAIQGAGSGAPLEQSLISSIPGAIVQGIQGATNSAALAELEEYTKFLITLRKSSLPKGEIIVGPVSGRGTIINQNELQDVTVKFYSQLAKTDLFFSNAREIFDNADFIVPGNLKTEKLRFFGEMVKTGAPFDIKQPGKGFSLEEIGRQAIFERNVYDFDDFGNINFGYAARVFGISLGGAVKAAGLYQTLFQGNPDFRNWQGFFDATKDTRNIKFGYNFTPIWAR